MRPQQIIASLSPATVSDLFRYLQKEEKAAFRSCLSTLAANRKLRPIFVERKPPDQRYAWMQREVARPGNEPIATNLLHIWLAGAKKSMIIDFLDSVGVEHDGDGGIDQLPPEPDAEKVNAGVEKLLATYPDEEVAAYLNAFQTMEESGWSRLESWLEQEPRLKLGTD